MLVSKRCAIVFSKWGKFLHSWGKRCAMGVGQHVGSYNPYCNWPATQVEVMPKSRSS